MTLESVGVSLSTPMVKFKKCRIYGAMKLRFRSMAAGNYIHMYLRVLCSHSNRFDEDHGARSTPSDDATTSGTVVGH